MRDVKEQATLVLFSEIPRGTGIVIFDFREDVLLAFREWDWGLGKSFWGTLAVYASISAVFALVGFVIWRVWPLPVTAACEVFNG